jgi:excisionase family DNA binding protein
MRDAENNAVPKDDRLLKPDEVAVRLRVSRQWVYAHAKGTRAPKLKAVRLGSLVRFRQEDIDAVIKEWNL